MIKLLALAVLFSVMQASPPVPRKASDSPASAGHDVDGDRTAHKTPTPPPMAVDSQMQAQPTQGNSPKQNQGNAEHSIVVRELPAVTVATPKRDWADWGYWAFNGLLVLVGGFQVWLLFKTLGAIQHQANISDQTLLLTQAADIHIKKFYLKPVPLQRETSLTMEIKNFGRTRAERVTHTLIAGIPGQETAPSQPRNAISVAIGADQEYIIFFGRIGDSLTDQGLIDVLNGSVRMRIWGSIHYWDVFKNGYMIRCEATYDPRTGDFFIDRYEHERDSDKDTPGGDGFSVPSVILSLLLPYRVHGRGASREMARG